ncbi:hypothetical protein [Paraburkholderia sp. BL9I2N2]|uniref:hypothetical protein n=1 Tax=Paraburkholderia sp. BL9I2N2 TaxID=1938809 RepID=UPI0010EB3681|nr:hypothetical protein [Paraburkholderia sp. BL9I2N2]TCK87340.1 hypothetical protein B0G74_7879 [Paraburkholderia sp. BL9I2N2]
MISSTRAGKKDKRRKLSRLWMIWPTGALEWTITQSPELAKHAAKQGWSVIEFREVRP